MKSAQVWSVDILLALAIFISVLIIFYVTMIVHQKPNIRGLQSDAGFLKMEFEMNPAYSFLNGNTINSSRLEQFADAAVSRYGALKEEFGITGDFCIYFEDEDGNLIILRNSTGSNLTGVGSGSINISNTPCGQAK
jgi:hypothetical protein